MEWKGNIPNVDNDDNRTKKLEFAFFTHWCLVNMIFALDGWLLSSLMTTTTEKKSFKDDDDTRIQTFSSLCKVYGIVFIERGVIRHRIWIVQNDWTTWDDTTWTFDYQYADVMDTIIHHCVLPSNECRLYSSRRTFRINRWQWQLWYICWPESNDDWWWSRSNNSTTNGDNDNRRLRRCWRRWCMCANECEMCGVNVRFARMPDQVLARCGGVAVVVVRSMTVDLSLPLFLSLPSLDAGEPSIRGYSRLMVPTTGRGHTHSNTCIHTHTYMRQPTNQSGIEV